MSRSALLMLVIGAIALLLLIGQFVEPQRASTQRPAPQVHISSHRSSATATPIIVTEMTPQPTHEPPTGSLEELARQAYGNRLVEWIRIPRLNLFAPVRPVGWQPNGETVEWDSPEAQVGWAVSSALPGDRGNVILYGHNNIDSSVFMRLGELHAGDRIQLTTGQKEWEYQVRQVEILAVTSEEENKQAYAAYFRDTGTTQLTVLSCWPPVSNTHRVIVVAEPVDAGKKE